MPEDLRWNAATLWAGPKCHIVHYPLSGWKVFNLVVTYHNDAPEPVAGQPVSEDGGAPGLRPRARAGAEHHPPRPQLEAVGAVRPRSGRALGRRPRRAAGRRRPSDAAILGPGRLPWRWRTRSCLSHMLAQSRRLRDGAGRLPRRSAFSRTARVQTDVARHRRAHLPSRRRARAACATPSWARSRRRSGTAIWPGSMAGRGWTGKTERCHAPRKRASNAAASRFERKTSLEYLDRPAFAGCNLRMKDR